MRAAPERRTVAHVACLALAVMCCVCACGSASADSADGAAQHGAVITIGSFGFPESALLADIYAGALTAQGFPVRVLPDLGPRELVDPALFSTIPAITADHLVVLADDRGLQPAENVVPLVRRDAVARSARGSSRCSTPSRRA